MDGYPGTEAAAFARLNLALCAMHFGDFAAAHSHLVKAKAELPQRPGLSQGTALYYLGLALENLGTEYRKEALEAYRAAAAVKDATLFNNDGPAVAPLASRRSAPVSRGRGPRSAPRLAAARRRPGRVPPGVAPMIVGRDADADMRVDEPLVSRAHARIERRGDAFFVVDLGSTNLTRVNGEVVAERQLRHGDEVRFARAVCLFVSDEAPDPVGQGV